MPAPTFSALGVPAVLDRTLAGQGIEAPFPIQAATLPDTLAGRDVLGRGRTGSGKTLAFAIPLVARLDAHLRKLGTLPAAPGGERPAEPAGTRTVGEVEIDLAARTARVRGRPVPLGLLEFRLLEYLVVNAGVALSREQILHEVHGYEDIQTDRVDLLVRRLRGKLGLGQWIVAVPGYGYRLERRG